MKQFTRTRTYRRPITESDEIDAVTQSLQNVFNAFPTLRTLRLQFQDGEVIAYDHNERPRT